MAGDLKAELTDDPLGRGYNGLGVANPGPGPMTDQGAADDLNTEYRTRNRISMSRTEIMQSIDKPEFDFLTDGQKADIWGVLGVNLVDPRAGSFEEHVFKAVFGQPSETLTALAVARVEAISRAVELEIRSPVRSGHVEAART